MIAKIDRFADDVLVWDYDKEDFSLRIDIVSGPLSELALEPAMAGDSSTSRADMTSRANMALRANMSSAWRRWLGHGRPRQPCRAAPLHAVTPPPASAGPAPAYLP